MRWGLKYLMNTDLRLDLHHLTVPSIYLFSRLDAIVPYKTMSEMQPIYPNFNYVLLKKGAHIPFLLDSQSFINIVKDFFV